MDSFEFNKVFGALLGTVFVVFSVGIVSDSIFAAPVPEKEGFAIEAAEPEAGGWRREAARPRSRSPCCLQAPILMPAQPSSRNAPPAIPSEKGGANKVGPNLWDIVNRPVASHEGFAYSAAMKEFAEGGTVVWDYDHLDHFLTSPKGLVKGTAMGFAGVKKPDERANLIAYLRTLADTPAPLPEAAAPAAEPACRPGRCGGPGLPAADEAAPPPAAEPAPAPAEPRASARSMTKL